MNKVYTVKEMSYEVFGSESVISIFSNKENAIKYCKLMGKGYYVDEYKIDEDLDIIEGKVK